MKNRLVLLTLTVLLSACGGGGGSTSGQAPVQSPPANVVSYKAGTSELTVFNAINDFRAITGLTVVAQSSSLDAAAQNHVKYLIANPDVDLAASNAKTGQPNFHYEDAARPGFTGATVAERAAFEKYGSTSVGEVGSFGAAPPAELVANLVGSVYHRELLMNQALRDIGIAHGSTGSQPLVVNLGYKTLQRNPSTYVGVYPTDGETGLRRSAAIEAPNPFPDVPASRIAQDTGYPVSISTEANTTLSVSSFTLSESGQSGTLDVRLLTSATDPNKLVLKNNAFIVTKSVLKPNTRYSVRFSGAVDGAPLTKEWSFVTGN